MSSSITQELRAAFFGVGLLFLLFALASWAVNEYEPYLQSLISENEEFGAIIYLVLAMTATVIAPLSALPLMPLVSVLYGWVWAAILSIVGWLFGAWIAFIIARRWGRRIVSHFVSLKSLDKLEAKIPTEHLFWYVVLLRIIVPADALSYALGLFSSIGTRQYLVATLLGITPFAFVWAYAGTLSLGVLMLVAAAVFVAYGMAWVVWRLIHN